MMMEKFGWLFILFVCTKGFDLESCRYPIGVESGKILDAAFSSSSHANENTVAAKARIRSETDGWCPLNPISSTTYEYLQIDFDYLMVITLIELQGKYSLKPNEQFADAFRIEYRRDREQKWIRYKDFSGQDILSGNSNSFIPTIRDILPSIIARQIRIIPVVTGLRSRNICMRLELYGCSYQDGLVSYSIPQGDRRDYNVQLFDETYDGNNENGMLRGGLGQLTDGLLGPDDYLLTDNDQIGYDWIGWKDRSNINLLFYFDTLRNFTSIHLHTSNFFTHNIHLFDSITIAKCTHRSDQQIDFLVPPDVTNSSARYIQISLGDETSFLSDCLNITLTANNRSQWILISEIQFDSTPIYFNNNVTFFIHYWHWLLFFISLCLISFISTFIYQIQSLNLRKFPLPTIGCCNKDKLYISTPDLRHQLLVSTTNSLTSSDFNSTINSYLTAVSNHTTNRYSSADMYLNPTQKTIQGSCGNSTYEYLTSFKELPSVVIPRWNCEQLIVGQAYLTIGGGYGTILRGYLYLRHPHDILKPILIKILITKDSTQKESFDQEHQLLQHLHHPNLVQFYGYTIEQNYALIEHSDLGDLHTYLSTSENIPKNRRLYLITQLSNALCYLEGEHILHRDIAARNCLIYPNYELKLTNSALASKEFQSHYYQLNEVRLPIRWMSPESISNNELTSQSDVWSFGITLWEVMTSCLTLPYSLLNDEEVYRRLIAAEGLHLAKPEGLNKEVIDLMLECWRPIHQRPTFKEISMFFNKRLDGIDMI